MNFLIEPQTAHIWQINLVDFFSQIEKYYNLLSVDEKERADRFHFPHHRDRFIIARGKLRELLSRYTQVPAEDILFRYGPRGKPYLENNSLDLQFNVSHSDDFAVYAFALHSEVGIDIEKIKSKDHDGLAKRFFSPVEIQELDALPVPERRPAFFQIWACKEAIIKAAGEGLFSPLDEFSVSFHLTSQWITLTHEQRTQHFYVEIIAAQPGFQAALASNQKFEKIILCSE